MCISVEGPGGKSVAKLADNNTPKTFRDVRRHAAAGGGGGARPKSSGRRVGGYRTNAFDSNVSIGHAPLPPPPPRTNSKQAYVTEELRCDINKILRKAGRGRVSPSLGVHGMVRKLRSCGDKAGVLCDTLALQRDDATTLVSGGRPRHEVEGRSRRLGRCSWTLLTPSTTKERAPSFDRRVQAYDAASHPEVLAGDAPRRRNASSWRPSRSTATGPRSKTSASTRERPRPSTTMLRSRDARAQRVAAVRGEAEPARRPRARHAPRRPPERRGPVRGRRRLPACCVLGGVRAIDAKLNDKNTRDVPVDARAPWM